MLHLAPLTPRFVPEAARWTFLVSTTMVWIIMGAYLFVDARNWRRLRWLQMWGMRAAGMAVIALIVFILTAP